ncbi:MAG: hypothetical protein KKE50_06880, partial [Nanoarchaeota archaeon]|nr:hypothetical protein [Nanoarchaeota archaeon]
MLKIQVINFSKDAISCLDFGGATSKEMIEHIPYYGSPDAATYGKNLVNKMVSGGHGNGGKYYALSQFKECQIINYYKGKITILLLNEKGDFISMKNEEVNPWNVIEEIGLKEWEYFEREGKELFSKIQRGVLNVFCWKGISPKDTKILSTNMELSKLIRAISNHPQARSALRTREVNILHNGKLMWPKLKPEEVDADESFGTREFQLPNDIEGYRFNKHFSSALKITLSKKPLLGDKSSMNILEIDSFGRNIAYYDIPSLMLDKGLSKSLFAHIDCPELKEYNCVTNDRVHLMEGGELTNLFLNWCRSKMQEVLEELTNKEKQKAEKKDLEELGGFLKAIVEEISDLLEEDILKQVYDKSGTNKSQVMAPTDKHGFGGEGHIKRPGGGKRRGETENKESESKDKKSKSRLDILLSNYHPDPLNQGKTYDMIERQPVLFQRVEDIDHGIWWINTQKRYIKKMSITDNPRAIPFYFFLVKDIIFSQRMRRLHKDMEQFDPEGIESLNFELINDIFNKVVERLGIELSFNQNITDKIREKIKSKEKFT